MKLVTANGTPVHPIGIGTWDIASRVNESLPNGLYRNIEAVQGNEVSEIEGLRYSIERGQNHIDCAELYGAFYTDEVVGQALDVDDIDRADLFIADKLWEQSTQPGATKPTVQRMLSKLRTDYLDLLYIHAPWPDVKWQAAIPQIGALIDEGVVRHFGVSNFTVAQMQEVQKTTEHPISANQMNFNCLHQSEVNDEFRSFCAQHDISIVAYQPVKRGEVLHHPVLAEIAAVRNATPAQIALAWLLEIEAMPIPKAIQKSHIDENLGALEISLSSAEMQRINSLH